MRHLSLFSGIGGFDLAARWMGWKNVAQVEIDKFCLKILEKNFPKTKRYEDIRTFPAKKYTGKIDIITGGFPCQPFSHAGSRRGTSDNRYLWPQMLATIRVVKPKWLVIENVRGLLTYDKGMVFQQVSIDLESAGYRVQAFLIPACAVGAPHKRERVWIIAHAYSSDDWDQVRSGEGKEDQVSRVDWPKNSPRGEFSRADGKDWLEIAAEICREDDGISGGVDRNKRLKALGNAIVPQVAYQIFKSIPIEKN